MALPGIAIGAGITIGAGIFMGTGSPLTTATGQNVTGVPDSTGVFFAVLNRGIPGWDTFAANGNNGSWTATGDFGSGTQTVSVISVTSDPDSVFPVVSGVQFQPGISYIFRGY
jgi:hypothetical protein